MTRGVVYGNRNPQRYDTADLFARVLISMAVLALGMTIQIA
jgi:hypothetical protein